MTEFRVYVNFNDIFSESSEMPRPDRCKRTVEKDGVVGWSQAGEKGGIGQQSD